MTANIDVDERTVRRRRLVDADAANQFGIFLFDAFCCGCQHLCILCGHATVTIDVARVFPFVIAAVVAFHGLLSVRVVTTLRRASLSSLLRKE